MESLGDSTHVPIKDSSNSGGNLDEESSSPCATSVNDVHSDECALVIVSVPNSSKYLETVGDGAENVKLEKSCAAEDSNAIMNTSVVSHLDLGGIS